MGVITPPPPPIFESVNLLSLCLSAAEKEQHLYTTVKTVKYFLLIFFFFLGGVGSSSFCIPLFKNASCGPVSCQFKAKYNQFKSVTVPPLPQKIGNINFGYKIEMFGFC